MKTFTTVSEFDQYIADLEAAKGWGPALTARRKYLSNTTPQFRRLYLEAFFSEGLMDALKNGQFYAEVSSVSRSGMSRHIALYLPYKDMDGALKIENLTYLLHHFCGYRWNKAQNAVIVGGCGMDMIFYTIDNLLYSLDLPKESPDGRQRASDYRII